MTERRNGGKLPQILKRGMTENPPNPKTRNGGMTERRNGGKLPQILKRGMSENPPKS